MVEEVKNDQQDQSAETADGVVEDNPAAGAEQDPESNKGNEAEDRTTPGDVKSIDPQTQTFWEDSVDANSVDLSEGETPQEEVTKEDGTDSTSTTPPPQEEEGKRDEIDQQTKQESLAVKDVEQEESPKAEEAPASETEPSEATTTVEETEEASTTPSPHEEDVKDKGETQPTEQEPAAAQDAEQEESSKEGESPATEIEPPEDTPAAEEARQPEPDEPEISTAKTEETEDASTAPPPQEEGKSDGEDQPSAQEPVAAEDVGKEETKTDTEAPDTAREESQAKGKVINFYEYLRKKRLLSGIGILLLVAGSIGYAVVPNLHFPGTITSTLLGGPPELAYNMKFFLPLKVGYEKAQFVKITIALELIDEGLQKELDKNLSDLRKEVIDLILTKSPKEVRSSDGKRELSREITRRINNYLSKDCIKDTYFTELVIL